MSWLSGLFGGVNKLWVALGGILSGVVAVLAIWRSGKAAGANEVVVKTKEKEVESVKEASSVEREVLTARPDDKRARLCDKWTRD